MLATLSTTVEIAGLELDLELEVSGEYADHGIGAFEYWGARGVHHEWGWDDLQLSSMFFEPGDINTALRRRQPHLSRKQFRKAVRRLRRQIETLIEAAAEKWVSDNENDCIDALAAQNEPDYEEGRTHGRSRFACAA
jgi:hypothetical protein